MNVPRISYVTNASQIYYDSCCVAMVTSCAYVDIDLKKKKVWSSACGFIVMLPLAMLTLMSDISHQVIIELLTCHSRVTGRCGGTKREGSSGRSTKSSLRSSTEILTIVRWHFSFPLYAHHPNSSLSSVRSLKEKKNSPEYRQMKSPLSSSWSSDVMFTYLCLKHCTVH